MAGLTVMALLATAATTHASSHVYVGVGIGVPAPVAVAPVPPPPVAPAYVPAAPYGYGYVWRPAYYVWTGYAYRAVPGAWVRPPYAGAVWVAPRWVSAPRGAYFVRGYWRHR
ncbi:MAG TPA: hypothetical protein VFA27_07355 [Vicinamibacterales bacterium]|nr:hypothetical protein [Vicinamibacterales bacterium]